MKRLASILQRAAAVVAIAGFVPALHAASAAPGILEKTEADKLKACIESKRPVGVCVTSAMPSTQDFRACEADFCKAATKAVADPEEISSEQLRVRLKEIALALGKVAEASNVLKAPAGSLRKNAERNAADLAEGKKVEANPWDTAASLNPAGDEARGLVEKECALPAGACVEEAQNLLVLRLSSNAARALVQRANWADLEKSVACTELLRKRYDSYFAASRFQWPWELYINGLPSVRGQAPLMCEGFRDVPTHQWIILHPTLGIRYNSNATDKYAAAIIIELIGIRRWQWSDGNAVNARGASLILSYSDQGESKKYGWGGMVHVNDDVSVGLVRHTSDGTHSSKTSLMLSYEFGKLASQDKGAACQKLFDKEFCSRIAK